MATAENWRQLALSVVSQLMQHQHAQSLFNSPVDVKGLGITDYFSVVNQPMDLGTVRDRLERPTSLPSVYLSPQQVFADVQLVWRNCIAYNTRPDEVYYADAARQMAALHVAMWDKVGLPRPVSPGGGLPSGVGASAALLPQQPPAVLRLLSEQQIPPGYDVIAGTLRPACAVGGSY